MPANKAQLEAMAEEVFELSKLGSLRRLRGRAPRTPELSESEFLTLDLLAKEQPLTIGEIQKRIGVVPAQMSRIIRGLEEGKGMVQCSINPDDRRRTDVTLTSAGQKACANYRSAKLQAMTETLSVLSPEDRDHFMRIMRLIREHISKRLANGKG